VRPAQPARAIWWAENLDGDSLIPVRTIGLYAAGGHRVELTLTGAAEVRGRVRVTLGGRTDEVDTIPGAVRTLARDLCGQAGVVRGRIDVLASGYVSDNRTGAGLMPRVKLTPCQ
jgi:hypothetical protein